MSQVMSDVMSGMAEIELPKAEPPRKRRTLRIPAGLDVLVVAYARKEGIAINDLYVFLVQEALQAALGRELYEKSVREGVQE